MSVDYAITELGAALGLGPMALPAHGALNIAWKEGARLSLELAGPDLLIYVTWPTPHLESGQQLALLQACDVRRNAPGERPVQLGLQGQGADAHLLMLMRWPSRSVQASQLLSSLQTFERHRLQWLGQAA